MSDFAPQLIQRIQKRMCRLLGAANRKPASSLLRLREFPDFERLPWDPALPALTIQALQLLDGLRQELNDELAWEGGISDCDVLRFALQSFNPNAGTMSGKTFFFDSNSISGMLGRTRLTDWAS